MGSLVCRVVESADEFDGWAGECLAVGERRGEKLSAARRRYGW